MKEKPLVTVSELAEELGISERAVNKHLATLRANGRIARSGGRKFGQWEIVKK